MRYGWVVVSLVWVVVMVSGCKSTGANRTESGVPTESSPAESSAQKESGIVGNIPPDSPFAKIQIGMPMKQVYDLIGPPTDNRHYQTGKAFIPFYHGSDVVRFEALYKGQGRITFAGGSGLRGTAYKVYRIVYDPKEEGYNK